MATYKMERDAEQAYVFTNKDGAITGTFKLDAIYLYVDGDTCEVRAQWHALEVFKRGVVVDMRALRPNHWNLHLCETGFRLPLITSGAMAGISAELEADLTDKGCVARAALLEFAREVEQHWSIGAFIKQMCALL